MTYITGDMHGDYTRLKAGIFPEQKAMTKTDSVIICGDFGLWDASAQQDYWLDWLENRPFTTLFVDGNHENFDLLNQYPVREWHGGKVHLIRPSVIHLMRGQLFNLDGKRIFTMGGASSHDISDGILEPDDPDLKKKKALLEKQGRYLYRINHLSWWKEELPNKEEYDAAKATLDACDWSADYIITHCAPSSIADILGGGSYQADALTDFLEDIRRRCSFTYWFFGHYHDNRVVMKKFVELYEQIIKLPE